MFQKHAVARIICRHIMRASVSARTIRTHNMSVQMYVRYACTYVRKSACHFRKGSRQLLYVGGLNNDVWANVIVSGVAKGRGAGKARFNVATPTNATVRCTAYILPYNLQTKSI